MKKALVLVLAILASYVTLEFWAQVRFGLQNSALPFGLRKNMGVNLYDAHHLTPDFYGRSNRKNIAYKTDQNGFSINPESTPVFKQKILIGGDSRAFSLFLPWEDSLAGQLEAKGQGVYLQAFPGSAPALFNHDLFDRKKIQALSPRPERIYYIYDRNDTFGDQQFEKELMNPLPWYSPRSIKIALGGYFWNMANVKFKSFLNKASFSKSAQLAAEEKPPENKQAPIEKPPSLSRNETFRVHRPALDRMRQECESLQIPLVMVYIPRFAELISQDSFVRDDLKAWCQSASIDYIDLYEPLEKICDQKADTVRPYFLDLNEGIHFSEKGLSLIVDAIVEYEERHR